MAGEYTAEGRAGWIYYVDVFAEGCTRCDHVHEGWALSGSPGGLTGKLGEYPTMREAQKAAETHQRNLA
ncbi:hypothetical protein PP713_13970 [Mycobacterium sp. CSUR Q5927]|nr:hypothetical protein [Mycobacterium sp. CSUR Q5927]